MSNQVFPALPGVTFPIVKRPQWSTSILTSASGKEVRLANYSYPLWQFDLPYDILHNTAAELQTLMGFYMKMQGSFDTFLFDDIEDNWAAGQVLGTGTGALTTFQLVRSLGGWIEPRYEIKTSPAANIYLNGVLQTSSYSIGATTGILTFTTAPGAGVSVTADFGFYYRCRFREDTVDFERFMSLFWETKMIPLISVK